MGNRRRFLTTRPTERGAPLGMTLRNVPGHTQHNAALPRFLHFSCIRRSVVAITVRTPISAVCVSNIKIVQDQTQEVCPDTRQCFGRCFDLTPPCLFRGDHQEHTIGNCRNDRCIRHSQHRRCVKKHDVIQLPHLRHKRLHPLRSQDLRRVGRNSPATEYV